MLHPAPFATLDHIQIVQSFMQRVAKGTVEIAVQQEGVRFATVIHGATLPNLENGVHRYFCCRTETEFLTVPPVWHTRRGTVSAGSYRLLPVLTDWSRHVSATLQPVEDSSSWSNSRYSLRQREKGKPPERVGRKAKGPKQGRGMFQGQPSRHNADSRTRTGGTAFPGLFLSGRQATARHTSKGGAT